MSLIIRIFLLINFISNVELSQPKIQLTFTPNEKYLSINQQIDIQCEIINPNERTESPQLWYVDLITGKSTHVSRTLLTTPSDDAPNVFKYNQNGRYVFIRKNHIRILNLQIEDSARYECDCPDCEQILPKQIQELQIMKLNQPKWIIEPGFPLHENTKATIKCQTDDFYPYVGHKILRNHQEITNDGKSSLSNNNVYPQQFIWEATITPTAEWHNSTLRCIVNEGNSEQQTNKVLDVLFSPRFHICNEHQYVDTKNNYSTIECSFTGNPHPKIIWLRQIDKKPIGGENGIKIETKYERNGIYKSIVTFDRNRLMTIPIKTINSSIENYYQQLLHYGFIVKLNIHGNDKLTRIINIIRDVNHTQSN